MEFDYFFKACTPKTLRDSLWWNHHCPVGETLFCGVSKSEITAIGFFVKDEAGFGHMNAYKFEFTIKSIEKVVPKK